MALHVKPLDKMQVLFVWCFCSGLLVKRHSGVLGLAALVEACPYSIPEWLPEVLDEMALHLHDRAPIQVSEWNRYLYCHNNEES